jgi:hypothetical protein
VSINYSRGALSRELIQEGRQTFIRNSTEIVCRHISCNLLCHEWCRQPIPVTTVYVGGGWNFPFCRRGVELPISGPKPSISKLEFHILTRSGYHSGENVKDHPFLGLLPVPTFNTWFTPTTDPVILQHARGWWNNDLQRSWSLPWTLPVLISNSPPGCLVSWSPTISSSGKPQTEKKKSFLCQSARGPATGNKSGGGPLSREINA